MEFMQFTGITFDKAKGRLEVTVSARVRGRPFGRGEDNHSHSGTVCCCAGKDQDRTSNISELRMTTYYVPFKIVAAPCSRHTFVHLTNHLLARTCLTQSITAMSPDPHGVLLWAVSWT